MTVADLKSMLDSLPGNRVVVLQDGPKGERHAPAIDVTLKSYSAMDDGFGCCNDDGDGMPCVVIAPCPCFRCQEVRTCDGGLGNVRA